MDIIQVNLKEKSYEILIGKGILEDLGDHLLKKMKPGRCAIISNPTVSKLYRSKVEQSLRSSGFNVVILEVPDHETSKSLTFAEQLYSELIKHKMDRDSCIVALGGGVIGDLAGFVAATYMRGIVLVQVPTTLLAQVDSAIGGKVAVDLETGKNLIGSFHQPILVLSDVETLKTLSKKEIQSGLAEVIKYGIIANKDLFELVENNMDKIFTKDIDILNEIVKRCSRIKTRIVENDEKEHGIRAILNFGHTLGHTLEAATNYHGYSHGEAISIGMIFASLLSIHFKELNNEEYQRIEKVIHKAGLPIRLTSSYDPKHIISLMRHDKKVKMEKIRFILPRTIGEVFITETISEMILEKELRKMFQ